MNDTDGNYDEDQRHSVDLQVLQDEDENQVPSINGPPYHGEYRLEAHEFQQPLPFPMTFIGMLPPEIREKIYIAALNIETIPVADYSYFRNNFYNSLNWSVYKPPEWLKAHQASVRKDDEDCRPQAKFQHSSSLAFRAAFPSPTHVTHRSCLALL